MGSFVSRDILKEIVKYSKRAPMDSLVGMAQGNFSARDPNTGYIAITPHNYSYDEMLITDLVIVDPDGNKVAGNFEPSFETPVHCTVYRDRPDVMAIAHTEPAYVNAFGSVRHEILPITTTMLKASGGTIPIMPYQRSGSKEFAHKMLELMGDRNAIVWANHGMLVIGLTLKEAYERSLVIEQGALCLFLAMQIGVPKTLVWIDDIASVEE